MIRLFESDPALRRVALRSWTGFLAFGFGAGLSRYAPGTVGTLVAVPPALLFVALPPALYWLALAASFVLGVYLCGTCSKRLGRHDPGGIVWDEMVAFWLTVAFLPLSWTWWALAFLLFRLFDIIKPWPIRQLEARVGGGLGIMLDDILAAAYAMLVLHGLQRLL